MKKMRLIDIVETGGKYSFALFMLSTMMSNGYERLRHDDIVGANLFFTFSVPAAYATYKIMDCWYNAIDEILED